jgi:hypothetical protein
VYYRILQIVQKVLAVIPPQGNLDLSDPALEPILPLLRAFQNNTLPGAEVVEYLLGVNSPPSANSAPGRLYCLVNPGKC